MTATGAEREIEIAAWRQNIEHKALILYAAMAMVAAYCALFASRNVLSSSFLLLAALAACASWLCASGSKHLGFYRAGIVIVLPLVLSTLLLTTEQLWIAYLAVPLVLVVALTRPGGEFLSLAAVCIAIIAAFILNPDAYDFGTQILPVVVVLAATVVIAHMLRESIERTFDWYSQANRSAQAALEEARTHRAQLAAALKTERTALLIQERARLEILQAKRQADDAKRMKEQFAANISHELRTPLNIILGFSELMHTSPHVYGDAAFPPKLRRDISHIFFSCKHLVNLIDDILDLSRFESAEFLLRRSVVSIESVVHETLESATDLFRDSAIELVVEDLRGLPDMLVDSTRLQQVLMNLLTNARRHTEKGKVTISAWLEWEHVIISVRDTGRGIPAHELNRIFEEFYQVDLSMSRPYQGAGLGLAICRKLVDAHGGRIWAEATEGAGARFLIALPVVERTPSLAKGGHQKERGGLRDKREVERVVALVDPDPALASLFKRTLASTRVESLREVAALDGEVHEAGFAAMIQNTDTDQCAQPVYRGIPLVRCRLPSRGALMAEHGVAKCLTKPVSSAEIISAYQEMGSPKRILMVDDDRGFCHLIGQVLCNFSPLIEFESAYGVGQGMQIVERLEPDFVIVDLALGEEDGRDFLRRMRSNNAYRQVPILLLTATDAPGTSSDFRSPTIEVSREPGFTIPETLRIISAIADTNAVAT